MPDFKVLIPIVPEASIDADVDQDFCQQANALIGQTVPPIAGIEGRTVTSIENVYPYPSRCSDKIIILVNTTEKV